MSVVIDGSSSVTINSGAILGITSGTAVASTSGTSIDFTGIPSWVKRITVMFSGVSTNGTSVVQIQLGTSGGVESTGYNTSSGGTAAAAAFNNNITTGVNFGGASAAIIASGNLTFCLIGSNVWVASGVYKSATNVMTMVASDKTLAGVLDRLRITTVNGTDTFDAGTINILYE